MRRILMSSLVGACAAGMLCGAAIAQTKPDVESDQSQQQVDVVESERIDEIQDPQICVQLTVDNLVGGSVATFNVAGGPPGELCAVMYSFSLGSYTGTWGPWCYDFGLDITPPPASQLVVLGPFNSVGIYSDTQFIPAAGSGFLVHLQAAVRNTCPDTCMSNIHSEVIG